MTGAIIAVVLAGSLGAGERYFTVKGGTLSGDFDSEFRGSIGIELRNGMPSEGEFAYDLGFDLAYSGDSEYFSMGAYFQPGYMVDRRTFVGATVGVQGGSLGNDVGVWGGTLGAVFKYDVTDEWRIGLEYRHEFDKAEGDIDIDADIFYVGLGYAF